MPSPFPGVDPYLEDPAHWTDFHHDLITALRECLIPLVAPAYWVAVEERVYIAWEGESGDEDVLRPDVLVNSRPRRAARREPHGRQPGIPTAVAEHALQVPHREALLEVRRREGHEVVTVIEVLSPTNKHPGEGQDSYQGKRARVLCSSANLIEIDLLRAGSRPPMLHPLPRADHMVLVTRRAERPRCAVYAWNLPDAMPPVPVPLRPGAPEPALDLKRALDIVYDRARYDMVLDYRRPPVPPLRPAAARWARKLLAGR